MPRTRIGTLRKLFIGGWPSGNPYDRACLPTSGSRSGRRFTDQDAENAAPPRQVSDRPMGLLVDADGQEALKRRTVFVKYANRGVARARELTRRIQHALKHSLEIKLGDERAPGFDQQFEAAFAFPGPACRPSNPIAPAYAPRGKARSPSWG